MIAYGNRLQKGISRARSVLVSNGKKNTPDLHNNVVESPAPKVYREPLASRWLFQPRRTGRTIWLSG